MPTVKNSSKSSEWYIPKWLDALNKEVLGHIHLDPASSLEANKTIKADKIFTKETDGIKSLWPTTPCTVYLNPPSGGRGSNSLVKLFWNKLIDYRNKGLLEHCLFMGFNIEQLQTTQLKCEESLADYPLCIPKRRIKFVSPEGDFNSPAHGNVIVYIPGNINNTSKFIDTFNPIGKCMFPYP